MARKYRRHQPLSAEGSYAGRADRRVRDRHPSGPFGGGTPLFTALDNWVNPNLVETRTFPDGVLLTRYKTKR
jgi:hypothetical protein